MFSGNTGALTERVPQMASKAQSCEYARSPRLRYHRGLFSESRVPRGPARGRPTTMTEQVTDNRMGARWGPMRARRCTTSPSSARAQPVSRRRCTRPAPDSPPRYSSASPPAASAPKPSTWRTTPATPDPPAASSYPWTCTIRPSPSGRRPSWKTSPPWTSPPSPTSSSRPSTPTSPARSSWPRARWPANSGCPRG